MLRLTSNNTDLELPTVIAPEDLEVDHPDYHVEVYPDEAHLYRMADIIAAEEEGEDLSTLDILARWEA